MLQLTLGFILGAIVAAVCITSGIGQRIYDYTSASDYAADGTEPAAPPAYATTGYGTEPPADQAPYQAPYEGPATSYANGAPLNISVVPAPASPGGDNFCSAYALSNRTNQAIVISYADAQSGLEAASDPGVVVQPGETKVHPTVAGNDRQRNESVYRENSYSYGDPLYREGPDDESSRDDGNEGRADATCATIEVKN